MFTKQSLVNLTTSLRPSEAAVYQLERIFEKVKGGHGHLLVSSLQS